MLATFGDDPRPLGGELRLVALLHTWGQTLVLHIHLHCVVTGGALARDGSRWVPAKRGFLFPVHALAPVFRAKVPRRVAPGVRPRRAPVRRARGGPGRAGAAFAAFLARRRAEDWVVYAKPPFGGPEQVLD